MFGLVSLLIVLALSVWIFWGFDDGVPRSVEDRDATYREVVDNAKEAVQKIEEATSLE